MSDLGSAGSTWLTHGLRQIYTQGSSSRRLAEYVLPFSASGRVGRFPAWLKGVDDISHEGLRTLLREEGVTFQRLKAWKASKDPR